MLLLCKDERKANPEDGGRLGREGASGCCRVSHDMVSARLTTRPRLRAMGYGLLLGLLHGLLRGLLHGLRRAGRGVWMGWAGGHAGLLSSVGAVLRSAPG